MRHYDAKDGRHLLFALRNTILPRIGWRVCFYGSLALALGALHTWVVPLPAVDPLGHSLLGVALGLLIVFRTNTSYDRYWDARKLWAGLITAARNLLRGAAVYGSANDGLVRLVVAYHVTLKRHLRGDRDLTEIEPLVTPEVYR